MTCSIFPFFRTFPSPNKNQSPSFPLAGAQKHMKTEQTRSLATTRTHHTPTHTVKTRVRTLHSAHPPRPK
jgi:hypothetical protein